MSRTVIRPAGPWRLFLALLLAGCGSEAAAPAEPAPAAGPAVPAAPAPTPAQPPVPVSAPVSTPVVDDTGPLGVAACDEYLAAYRACITETLPEEARVHHTAVVDGQRRAWGRATGAVKDRLGDECTTARLAAKVGLPECTKL